MLQGVSSLLASIERDDALRELQANLTKDLQGDFNTCGDAYRRVVSGVVAALAKVDSVDAAGSLNAECLVMLEDIAAYGRLIYPWSLVKMCLVVVWSHLFDEVYNSEAGSVGCKYDEQSFADEKRNCLALLLKLRYPPITLQRLSEILLNQPYNSVSKLFHAYRKVISVGTMPSDQCDSFNDEELEDSELMKAVLDNLRAWETSLTDADDAVSESDMWLEDTEQSPVVESGVVKRPLDSFC